MSGRLVVRPMRPADLPFIRLQPAQRALGPELTPATGDAMRRVGLAFTALENGRPILAAGLILSMGPPPIAWAVLSTAAGRHLLALSRRVLFVLDGCETVETGVDPGFAAGRRWARLLGFHPTGRPVERWDAAGPLEVWRRGPANGSVEHVGR